MPMYLHGHKIIKIVQSIVSPDNNIEENLLLAHMALAKYQVVPQKEIETLKIWLKDLATLRAAS